MNSQEVMEKMHRYLDGDLDERETARLMDHLRQSPESAAMFERLKQLHLELAQLPKVTPPHSIVDAILPRLEAVASAGKQTAGTPAAQERKPRGSRTFARWAGGAAVTAAALLFVIVLRPGMDDGTNMAETVADDGQEMAFMMNTEADVRSMSVTDQMGTADGGAPSMDVKSSGAFDPDAPVSESPAGAGEGSGEPAPDGGEEFSVALTSVAEKQQSVMGMMAIDQADTAGNDNEMDVWAADAEGGPEGWRVIVAPAADGTQVIIKDEADRSVYVSAGYPGEPVQFRWSEDGHTLSFDIEMNGGLHRVSIDVQERTEQTVPLTP